LEDLSYDLEGLPVIERYGQSDAGVEAGHLHRGISYEAPIARRIRRVLPLVLAVEAHEPTGMALTVVEPHDLTAARVVLVEGPAGRAGSRTKHRLGGFAFGYMIERAREFERAVARATRSARGAGGAEEGVVPLPVGMAPKFPTSAASRRRRWRAAW